ncbi:MAG TPA: PAS domain-containing protein [Pyrinomonadaceae bacterium]|jgi:PAS domain S-box-containing protein|nr:PAS domain-containing protein [Pyrinomonadaceae bacterium]
MSDLAISQADLRPAAASRDRTVWRRTIAVALLVAVAYYLAVKIGFAFALQPGSVSTLWMPNSILLVGLLLVPKRYWWLVVLAACPAHFASEVQSGVPTAMILSWFISNSFQALFGAYFICRFVDGRLRFDKLRDLTIFLFFGAFMAPFLSSFLDVALVKLNGWGTSSFWEIWRVRCLSNILATLTLVPVIVTWAGGGFTAVRRASWARYVEAGVLSAGLVAVGLTVFISQHELAEKTPSLLYWPLPFLLWATVRFGPRGISTALLLVMFLAIGGATRGQGPFVENSAETNALSIQWFLIVVSIPLMALAAVIQERGRAERSARQNEQHLGMAMNAAQMGTWEWTIGDETAKWSDETKRIFGRSPSEPEGTNEEFYSWIHPDDRLSVEQAIERAVHEGSPYETEFRILLPDGGIRWVRGKGNVLRDETGNPLRMVGLNADITEQKKAQEALRESEVRLARAEAFSLVMLTHVGLDGRWLKVPGTLCELLGYTEAELLERTFKDVTHPDDFESDWSQCERLIRGEIKSFDLEKRYRHKDGHTLWVYLNCSVVEDNAGKPVHFITYIRDITDRKFAEQALLESNERNQAILRALPDLMFLQNKEGVYLDYYARDPQDLLVPAATFLGKDIREVLPAELAERIMGAFEELDGSVETRVLEYSLAIANEERHFEARIVSAEGDKVLTIVRNVTESRRAADALRRSEEKLLLSNRQARELTARLITAQESERRRIALLLHDDLSQNIAALGVAISRLKRKPPASHDLMAVELDQLNAQTNQLTTQIRRLSHQLHPDVLEHVGLVAALESELAEFGHNEQIKVEFSAEIKSEHIPLDVSVCLYRVAIEALRNVSRHSGASSASVALVEDDAGFTLEVSDSGQGFDVERAKRGSGLGLISAEERVKLLQGSFLVKSKPEGGTVILARIPLTK